MARPVQGTLVELLQRDHMHARDIGVVLESLRQQLAQEGIPFALIGALALRHYGYARHTEDIGILTTPEGLDRIHATLVGRGLLPRGPGLRKSLRETVHQVNVGQIAICRGGYPTGWAGAFSMERQMRCLDDFQRQGYERLPE